MKLLTKVLEKILIGLGILLGIGFFIAISGVVIWALVNPFISMQEHDVETRVFCFVMGLIMLGVVLGGVYVFLCEMQNPSSSRYGQVIPPASLQPKPPKQEKESKSILP